jgi:hypothetical protein
MTDPSDLLDHIAGTWHLERTISTGSRFQGLAHIRPTDMRNTYSYHEEGSFVHEQTAHEVYRDYIYKVKDEKLEIIFADPHRAGEHYVTLDFRQGPTADDTYLCGDDIYAHIFEIISAHEFHTETVVSGPEKDYRLQSYYRRL